MSEIELRKTLIFRIELRQAQPPGRNNFLCPDPDFDDAQSPGWKIGKKNFCPDPKG